MSLWIWWLGLALLLAFFPLIASVIAELSGWRRLAEKYPLQGEFPTPHRCFQSLWLNNGRYRRVVCMAETPYGVCLRLMWLFQAGHPPLCIPWNEIEILAERPPWWMAFTVRVRLCSMPKERLYISTKTKRRWEPYLRRTLSPEHHVPHPHPPPRTDLPDRRR